jgi:hypothetical protein
MQGLNRRLAKLDATTEWTIKALLLDWIVPFGHKNAPAMAKEADGQRANAGHCF